MTEGSRMASKQTDVGKVEDVVHNRGPLSAVLSLDLSIP